MTSTLKAKLSSLPQSRQNKIKQRAAELIKRKKRNFQACLVILLSGLAYFEWLQSLVTGNLFNSISTSQLPFLPVMQIASLTGFLGVTFIVSLFASAVAYAIAFNQKEQSFGAALSVQRLFYYVLSMDFLGLIRSEQNLQITYG